MLGGLGSYYGRVIESSNNVWALGYSSTRTGAVTNAVVWDSSGNLGLGVTPSAWGTYKALQVGSGASVWAGGGGNAYFGSNYYFDGSNRRYINSAEAGQYAITNGTHAWYTAPSGTAGDAITFTQAATLLASGDYLLGTTTQDSGAKFTLYDAGQVGLSFVSTGTSSQGRVYFKNANGVVGQIYTDGSATTYATSSDYRLKNITGPITNSGAYIDSLNPVEGTWKADGSVFVGLIAHEVQEASRTQVATGVKDGEEMQGMDYSNSEIIANLIAEVKSLRARVAQLESN